MQGEWRAHPRRCARRGRGSRVQHCWLFHTVDRARHSDGVVLSMQASACRSASSYCTARRRIVAPSAAHTYIKLVDVHMRDGILYRSGHKLDFGGHSRPLNGAVCNYLRSEVLQESVDTASSPGQISGLRV
jgi:hypothetical protein